MFSLVLERMQWMDREGIEHWNVVGYDKLYPLSYYEEKCRDGLAFALEDENGEPVCAAVLLEHDDRWEDDAPSLYVHNLASKLGERDAGAEFLRRAGGSCDLAACFDRAREEFRFVVHPADGTGGGQLTALEHAEREDAFGRELLAQSLLFQFLIGLNRAMADDLLQYAKPAAYDRKIESILRYLSAHLTEPVSIDDLAARFFVSKYHMMRQFRAQTGYTIHGYLTGKRLMRARALIAGGTPVLRAFGTTSKYSNKSPFDLGIRKEERTSSGVRDEKKPLAFCSSLDKRSKALSRLLVSSNSQPHSGHTTLEAGTAAPHCGHFLTRPTLVDGSSFFLNSPIILFCYCFTL